MTGFGNVCFFKAKKDFSPLRVAQMMWRLNFFVVALIWTMNKTWLLYYICPLHTFHFFLTYAVCGSAHLLSFKFPHGAYPVSVGFFVVFIAIAWATPLYDVLWYFVQTEPTIGATYAAAWEWYFRTFLDHMSSLFGMVFALNMETFSQWIEDEPSTLLPAAMLVGWGYTTFTFTKLDYNQWHPFIFPGFVLTYVYFRNRFAILRQYHLGLLTEVGKITLETYLLQHHVWMADSAKSLVVLVPGWPLVNFVVVTALYFLLAKQLHTATSVLWAREICEIPIKIHRHLAYNWQIC